MQDRRSNFEYEDLLDRANTLLVMDSLDSRDVIESHLESLIGEGHLISAPFERLVVADPPRAGLAKEVVGYLSGAPAAQRFAYVSCDPATLARDLGLLLRGGWALENLRAFDAFPMTHHVECVATLTR